jgi:hypothetical protein
MSETHDTAYCEPPRRLDATHFLHIGNDESKGEKFLFFRRNALKSPESDE